MGKNGTFRLLSDFASKNNEIPQRLALLVFFFFFFLVRARECEGQAMGLWMADYVSGWPLGSLMGKERRNSPSPVLLPASP